jgi:hypothetical protein
MANSSSLRLLGTAILKRGGSIRPLTDNSVHSNAFRSRAGQQKAANAFTELKNEIPMTAAEDDSVAAHEGRIGTRECEFLGDHRTSLGSTCHPQNPNRHPGTE